MRLAFVINDNQLIVTKYHKKAPKISAKKIWRLREKYYIRFQSIKKA